MELRTDPKAVCDEIGLITSLAMQADGLEPDQALAVYMDVAQRVGRIQQDLNTDEATIRTRAEGANVPTALDAIARARAALWRVLASLESRLEDIGVLPSRGSRVA
jgi:hypothetical protein